MHAVELGVAHASHSSIFLTAVGGDHDRVGADERNRIQRLHVTHFDVRQVARRQVQVLVASR
jgi:hypothetical protein